MSSNADPHETVPPVFLFGFERSGTTLLSMMMGAHPRLAVPFSTTGLWYRTARRLDDYDRLRTRGALARLVDDLCADERIRLWDVRLQREELLGGLPRGDYARLVERFHRRYAHHAGKDCWGCIDIDTLYEMDQANAWFPEARFVHIVRDVRDVALSHRTYPYGASNDAECAEQWARDVHANVKMGAILGARRYRVVRYEDLILAPEATLAGICDFIGLPYSPQMLDYPRATAAKVPEDRRWLWPLLDSAPVAANVYKWKTHMGGAARTVCERIARPLLENFGYDVTPTTALAPAADLLELWYFLGRGHRFRRLAARLGLRVAKARPRAPAPSPKTELARS